MNGETARSFVSDDQRVKVRLQLGYCEVEYEGSETFLRSEIPKLLEAMDGFKANRPYPDLADAKDLANLVDEIKRDLDSPSELGEMVSLRLQIAMNRFSQLLETLSNVLKKMSDTADQISQNLK
jgi:hypothetical protein